jgi:integrase
VVSCRLMEAQPKCGAVCGAGMAILSDLKARNMKPNDRPIADGTVSGLRLHPGKEKGQGKWLLRFVSPETNKRREMGFGVYPEVGITEARKAAAATRELIRDGRDPIEARKAITHARHRDARALTFEKAARKVHEDLQPGWQNPRHAANWITSLEMYVFPHIGNRKVDSLKARDFADALRFIWIDKAETASRVKQRCSTVMDWCAAQELIGANPVGVVAKLLPKQPSLRERVKHQPAMPWRDVPEFAESLLRTGKPSLSKTMLEFLVLTAARSGEVRAMTWDEVDLDAAVWAVPAERMKTKTAHRVPLSERAAEILQSQKERADHPTLVFPSLRGKVPSDMILTKLLRDHNVESSEPGRTATAHGYRSSFRDWASENGYARDLAERALAHAISNQAEAAYHRTDLLDQRRGMMESWSRFVCGLPVEGDNVVQIARSGKKK